MFKLRLFGVVSVLAAVLFAFAAIGPATEAQGNPTTTTGNVHNIGGLVTVVLANTQALNNPNVQNVLNNDINNNNVQIVYLQNVLNHNQVRALNHLIYQNSILNNNFNNIQNLVSNDTVLSNFLNQSLNGNTVPVTVGPVAIDVLSGVPVIYVL